MRFLPLRILAIVALALAILLPLQLIRSKVEERRGVAQRVVQEFATETSGAQVIAGPFLALTCEETYTEDRIVVRRDKAETVPIARVEPCPTVYFTPQRLAVNVDMPVETRWRGIYRIRHYVAKVNATGEFLWPQVPATRDGRQRGWKDAFLVWHVRDARGIKAFASGTGQPLLAGVGESGIDTFTLREALGSARGRAAGSSLAFSYQGALGGTGSFEVVPVGDRSEIAMASNWPHPSFGRGWSPDQREVSRDGFAASWRVSSLSTGGNSTWTKLATEGKLATAGGAGVALFEPIDAYVLSYRAVEYGFLFILFTFTAFGLTEVVAGIRMHPIQYALVGCAIAVFFLLLLALSEHVRFDLAYAMAATACVSLITAYLRPVLATWAAAAGYCAIFGGMYAMLYVLLRSEDHALLIGSGLVFLLLAIVMLATRRLDWTALLRQAGARA